MNDTFDKTLRGQLSEDDRAFLDALDEERGLYAQLADTFAGPMRRWTVFAFVLSLVFFGTAIYTAVQLAQAPSTGEALLWLAGVLCSMLAVAMFKIWFWMRMNQITLLRELKKIELRVAQLAEGGSV